jgi:hypothetical protein
MIALFEGAGFVDVRVLHHERNARTGNEAAVVLTIAARKPR